MNYLNFKLLSQLTIGFLFFILLSCKNSQSINIEQLKGYWEIDFISQQKETFKSISSAPLYDHYALEEMSGYYKKVAPSITGTFETSDYMTEFKIKKTDAGVFLNFKTPWDEWRKKILQLDSQKLILEHEKRTFHYKRPILINLNP